MIWWRGLSPYYRTVRQCHLDEFQTYPFLIINNITVPVLNSSRWYGRLTAEEASWKNDSITYFNDSIDNSILDDEGNACGIISIPSIEITFDYDPIHVLYDITKQYI